MGHQGPSLSQLDTGRSSSLLLRVGCRFPLSRFLLAALLPCESASAQARGEEPHAATSQGSHREVSVRHHHLEGTLD